MNRNHKRAAAGYTLIELMLVVVIFSILLSIVLPRYGGLVIKANQAKAKSNLGALRTTISIFSRPFS
jgi:general secretion pathway protein G